MLALMRFRAMPSSVIRRFVYDENEGDLWVEFTTGRRYVYSEVPQEVADALRSAFAKGVAVYPTYWARGRICSNSTITRFVSVRVRSLILRGSIVLIEA